MVGFNKIILIMSLLLSMLLAGCVPQAKKTDCGENESFNPALRTCAPVNPSPEGLINIVSAMPTAPVNVNAISGMPITLSIAIQNPYARPYRVKWIRNYNGTLTTLISASTLSASFSSHPTSLTVEPNDELEGGIGTHTISAQIMDSASNIVDSHDFTVVLTNNVTPYGNGHLPPLTLTKVMSPANPESQTFSFTVFRNGAPLVSPQVLWSLNKLTGTPVAARTKTDPLTFPTPTTGVPVGFVIDSTNPMNLITPPTAPYTDTIGFYRLTATIMDGTTVYATYSWDIDFTHPSLGVVSTATLPTPGVAGMQITAFNGVPYSNTTSPNFTYNNGVTRAQMCVQVSDPDGRYGGGTMVNFYVGNNPSPVFTANTNVGDDTICLEDAPTAPVNVKQTIVFTDPDMDLFFSSGIRARVFDVDTMEEYKAYTGGVYPPAWVVNLRPQNQRPTVTFEDIPGTTVTCASVNTAGNVKNGCAVVQSNATTNKSFVVAFRVSDDHYTFPANDNQISYSAVLTRGAATIDSTSCVKTFADIGTDTDDGSANIDDYIGPVYRCRFRVPSFDSVGSINPTLDVYSVSLNVTDNGSPFTATQRSAGLTWNFSVTELNTAPTISSVISLNVAPYTTIASTIEGQTIAFNTTFTDPERDPYRLELRRCGAGSTAVSCLTPSSPLVSSTVAFFSDPDYGVPTPNRRITFTIPDGFIADVATPTTVYFQVRAIDQTSTTTAVDPTGVITTSYAVNTIVGLDITNLNPAPVFTNPAALDLNAGVAVDYKTITGMPITLDPGTVTDASNPNNPAEGNIVYQWWIKPSASGTWVQIANATSRVLKWSAGENIAAGNYDVKACASDSSPLRPNALNPNAAGFNCNTFATIKVEPNHTRANLPVLVDRTPVIQPAMWVDTSAASIVPARPNSKVVYTAAPVLDTSASPAPGNIKIVVNKFYYNADNEGRMDFISSFEFDALPSGAVTAEVKDLSITGDDDHLFIGYLAYIGVPPATYRPQLRRLVKTFSTTTVPGAKTNFSHPAPFGFSYTGFDVAAAPVCAVPGCFNDGTDHGDYTPTEGFTNLDVAALHAATAGGNTAQVSINGTVLNVVGVTVDAMGLDIEAKINAHASLAGIVARADTGTDMVTITGPRANDSIQIDNNSTMMGKIFIAGSMVYVPYINNSLASPDTDKITIASVPTTGGLNLAVVGEHIFTNFSRASYITNTLDDSGDLLLGIISATTPGQARIIKINNMNFNDAGNSDRAILGSVSVSRLDLAPDVPGNPHYHVLAKDTSGKHWVNRLPENLSALTAFYRMEDTTDTNTSGVFTSSTIYDFKIATAYPKAPAVASTEARITILTDNGLYALRGEASDLVQCGTCLPVNLPSYVPENDILYKSLNMSTIIPAVQLGTGGNSASENTRNFLVYGFISNDGDQKYTLGLINADNEIIQSTTREATGLYRPAIFK